MAEIIIVRSGLTFPEMENHVVYGVAVAVTIAVAIIVIATQ